MQANVGWAKKGTNVPSASQSLTDIQAATWKQAAAIAQATSQQVLDEAQPPTVTPMQANLIAPWANTQNGGELFLFSLFIHFKYEFPKLSYYSISSMLYSHHSVCFIVISNS